MAGIPITRLTVSPEKAEAIRSSFRSPKRLPSSDAILVKSSDAEEMTRFLSDPRVHAPIYTLPRPLSIVSVATFVEDHIQQMREGTGLMYVRKNDDGRIVSYSDIQVWPEWAACELGGALHPDLQGARSGVEGARASFDWLFKEMQIELICETAALDNIRTARLLDGLGFKRMGEVESTRPDGTTRRSLVWEMTKENWLSISNGH